jgi:hypothetical protein
MVRQTEYKKIMGVNDNTLIYVGCYDNEAAHPWRKNLLLFLEELIQRDLGNG